MYLLDERMLDEALCGWLEQELEFPKLGGTACRNLKPDGTVAEFVCLYFARNRIF